MRKGLGHVNKALEAVQAASQSLQAISLHTSDSAKEEAKKRAMFKKMQALQTQIQNDFKKVISLPHLLLASPRSLRIYLGVGISVPCLHLV